jgi:23S rRNA (guanosine2251-2'-O)-methyltransferase
MQRVVILENIRSLHNVGAIFRTADSAGWDRVYLCGYTGCPPDRRIEKVSLGAENAVEWKHFPNTTEAIVELKNNGFTIVALEQTVSSTELFRAPTETQKLALILGNEVEGVSSDALKLTDVSYEIPMFGHKTSLNVSVAAGIAFYHWRKRT